MADETTTTKVDLATAHPEIDERYGRMRSLVLELRERTRRGGAVPGETQSEAEALVLWAETVASEVVGDLAAFRARLDRDRPAFAVALRVSGDELVARQLLDAVVELQAEL
jgi:hypothetical protein